MRVKALDKELQVLVELDSLLKVLVIEAMVLNRYLHELKLPIDKPKHLGLSDVLVEDVLGHLLVKFLSDDWESDVVLLAPFLEVLQRAVQVLIGRVLIKVLAELQNHLLVSTCAQVECVVQDELSIVLSFPLVIVLVQFE